MMYQLRVKFAQSALYPNLEKFYKTPKPTQFPIVFTIGDWLSGCFGSGIIVFLM